MLVAILVSFAAALLFGIPWTAVITADQRDREVYRMRDADLARAMLVRRLRGRS